MIKEKIFIKSLLLCLAGAAASVQSAPVLLGVGELSGAVDQSGLSEILENGVDHGDVLGGTGSGLAWAGGNRFLAIPDRGPNATEWNAELDHTTSYLSRFQEINMTVQRAPRGSALPLLITPVLSKTTLLFSPIDLNYGGVTPSKNSASRYFFSGRSDNYVGGDSLHPLDGRLDPEAICLASDRKSVFISDEYGPKVNQFNRATGKLMRSFKLPVAFSAAKLSPMGSVEISGNLFGRVANKGMEGLTITPDGTTLVGFEQSPLLQDGGDGGRANRIVTINLSTGQTHQYVYDNYLDDKGKTYNSSEILAINNHEFLILERDGKGQGDGSEAKVKRLYKIDLDGATDIGALNDGDGIQGEANLLPHAAQKTLFLDIKAALNTYGIADNAIPAKLEGAAFGADVKVGATTYHTLWIANDNDFLPILAGSNRFYVFGFTDADLGANGAGAPTQLVRQF